MEQCMSYRGYRGTINFSEELQCFFGKIDDISLLVCYEGDTRMTLQSAFERAVDDYVLNCARLGRDPERPYPRLACQ
jgi:predicted HicB family RNase H-like nuclease